MFDAFAQWNRMLAAGASMRTTSVRAAETFGGANKVVAARGAIIGEALQSPWTADHAELGRIIPEKIDTLSRAGSAAATIWWDSQTAWMKHFQHLGTMAMRGRLPTPPEIGDLGERSATLMLQSIEATARIGAASLAPVHRQVATNVRRLGAKRPAAKGRGASRR
jgi:hypothetical protein